MLFDLSGPMDNFIRVSNTPKFIDVFNNLFSKQADVMYNHSLIHPFSYLNKGRLELYINKDYSDDKIIPVVKKFKTTPSYMLYTPHANTEDILEVVNNLDKISKDPVYITDATEEYCTKFLSESPNWKKFRTSDDIIYDTKLVSEMRGKDFVKIRNKIKVCGKLNPDVQVISTAKHRDDAIYIFRKWKDTQGLKYFRVTIGRDIRLLEEYYDKVDLKDIFGYIAYVDKKPAGVVLGCRSNHAKDWGIEVTTKSLIDYNGMSDYIRQYFLSEMNKAGINYINDSGIYSPGIKKNKIKWKPDRFIKMYDLKRV